MEGTPANKLLTSQLQFGARLERISLLAAHHALVHALVLAGHARNLQRVADPARAGQLPAVLEPGDVLGARVDSVRRNQTPELGRAAHVNT